MSGIAIRFAALLTTLIPAPVAAQLSGSVTVASDDRLRGRSISAGDPIASGSIAYDSPGGLYAEASAAIAIAPQLSPRLVSVAVDAGYARRLPDGLTIDAGITRLQLTGGTSEGRTTGYTEIYAGMSNRSLSARIALSPDYYLPGRHTLYASLAYVMHPLTKWSLGSHLGVLAPLGPGSPNMRRPALDETLTLMRRLGRIDMGLALTRASTAATGAPAKAHPQLVASATIAF